MRLSIKRLNERRVETEKNVASRKKGKTVGGKRGEPLFKLEKKRVGRGVSVNYWLRID